MNRKHLSGQRITPMGALMSDALEKTLSPLGDGAKAAVLFTLEHKYSLPVKGPILSFDNVSHAVLDLFGQDGGRLLLEKLWVNLEELAESKRAVAFESESLQTIEHVPTAEEEFNYQVSQIFTNLISEMMGQDVYTWLEGKVRDTGSTLNNLYFDADKILPVIYSSFSSAANFLLDMLVVKVSVSVDVKEVHYERGLSLKAILDGIRQQTSA